MTACENSNCHLRQAIELLEECHSERHAVDTGDDELEEVSCNQAIAMAMTHIGAELLSEDELAPTVSMLAQMLSQHGREWLIERLGERGGALGLIVQGIKSGEISLN